MSAATLANIVWHQHFYHRLHWFTSPSQILRQDCAANVAEARCTHLEEPGAHFCLLVRVLGHGLWLCGLPPGPGLAAALSGCGVPPLSAGWDAFAGRPPLLTVPELLPTQSSRRRVPPSQPADSKAARVLLMSGCCFQSHFCKTGVDVISSLIRSSSIQVRTADSYRHDVLLTCTYPEIFSRPSSGNHRRRRNFPVH